MDNNNTNDEEKTPLWAKIMMIIVFGWFTLVIIGLILIAIEELGRIIKGD